MTTEPTPDLVARVDRDAAAALGHACGVPDITGPRQQQIIAEAFARHRLSALIEASEPVAFPDIGSNHPLQMEREERAKYDERLLAAYVVQQKGVPDQAALVWRDDLGQQRRELVTLRARAERLSRQPSEAERIAVLDWFSTQRRLELTHYSPMYCDDDDQAIEWRVHRQHGSINDREWTLVGRGETAFAAMLDARSTLKDKSDAAAG